MGILTRLRDIIRAIRHDRHLYLVQATYDLYREKGASDVEATCSMMIYALFSGKERRLRLEQPGNFLLLARLLGDRDSAIHFLHLCRKYNNTKAVLVAITLDREAEQRGSFMVVAHPLIQTARSLIQAYIDREVTDDTLSDAVMMCYWSTITCPLNPTGWCVLAGLDAAWKVRRNGDDRDFISHGLEAIDAIRNSNDRLLSALAADASVMGVERWLLLLREARQNGVARLADGTDVRPIDILGAMVVG